jgi:hypothetical protein
MSAHAGWQMSALGGWAAYGQDRINDLLLLLERCAEALERIADASEEPEPNDEENDE